ncbi:hypothetical protein LUCX_311 [Xanthomonas phage vB_XciM_LucasX]|nr:hypothetical protein LUCX_311 [Xanthomonas phage vB_XciM_LucasX]
MGDFRFANKRYERITPRLLISYIRDERKEAKHDLDQYEELSLFDIGQDTCFLLYIDATPVGFATASQNHTGRRQLTKLYVTPKFRQHGCASYFIRQIRITDIQVPVRYGVMDRLCRKMGFQPAGKQPYPKSLTVFERITQEVPRNVAAY